MIEYRGQIDELRRQAHRAGPGATQVALFEEAVALADQHGDLQAGFDLRRDLIIAAADAARHEVELVTFAWMLAQCDRNPQRFPEEPILWFYKWIIGSLIRLPQVSLDQIEAMLADMESRFRRAGSTLRAIHAKRWHLQQHRGDRAASQQAYEAWNMTPRDRFSDCSACERAHRVQYLLNMGDHQSALAFAQPILDGRHQCSTVPQRTLADVLIPLLQLGRFEEAAVYQRRGYRMIVGNPDKFAFSFGDHMSFLALSGQIPRALKLIEKHYPAIDSSNSLLDQFHFFSDIVLVLKCAIKSGSPERRIRLPRTFPLYRPRGPYDLSELIAWFSEQAKAIGDQFDVRNGTTAFRVRFADRLRLQRLFRPPT